MAQKIAALGRIAKSFLFLVISLASFLSLGTTSSDADTSPRHRGTPNDWFDQAGHKIRTRDLQGRVFRYWYDQEGRIMKTAGLAYTVSAKDPRPENGNPEAWVHCFTYTSQGELCDEIDCVGERFPVAVGAKLTPEGGATLENHRHIRATGWMGPKPASQTAPVGGELWKEGEK